MSINLIADDRLLALDMEKLRAGDPEHFQLLYSTFRDDCLQEARETLMGQEQAAGIVYRSFIKCWLRSGQFTSLKHLLGFLNYAIRNQCLHFNKGSLQRQEYQDAILNSILSQPPTNTEWRTGDEQAKSVFQLYFERQKAIPDIAQELGLTPSETEKQINAVCTVLHFILGY